jgi:hypothetical protein
MYGNPKDAEVNGDTLYDLHYPILLACCFCYCVLNEGTRCNHSYLDKANLWALQFIISYLLD